MDKTACGNFLNKYNQELLTYEEVVDLLPSEIIDSGWLGYEGASDKQLAVLEKRLGAKLPFSYREFLKASNGWHYPSGFIFELFPAAKVNWFNKHNQEWIDAYVGALEAYGEDKTTISDRKYLVYGAKQDPCAYRTEYLQSALQISAEGDSAVLLLNPKVVTEKGEWETWFFANWLPGAVRYRSFAEWFEAERKAARKQFKVIHVAEKKQATASKKPGSVKKAQALARSGQTEAAIEALENFAALGDDAAAASLAELYAFTGQWEKVISNAGRLIANPGAVYAGNVFDDMILLLGRAGHESGEWKEVLTVVRAAQKANDERDYGKYGQPMQARNEKVFSNLIKYAERKGKPPHELLAIFGVRGCMDLMTQEEREAWYANAVENVDSLRPDLKKNPLAKAEHLFSLAQEGMDDDALKIYEAHGAKFVMKWTAALHVARIYLRRGQAAKAWAALEPALSDWRPVDHAQVAPVQLLIDSDLRKVMTVERCRLVLSAPRGVEGRPKGK